MGNSDKQAENRIMPLKKGFPSKHKVKEEKEAIKNSGTYLSIKKHIQKIGHLTLFGMGMIFHLSHVINLFMGSGAPMINTMPSSFQLQEDEY